MSLFCVYYGLIRAILGEAKQPYEEMPKSKDMETSKYLHSASTSSLTFRQISKEIVEICNPKGSFRILSFVICYIMSGLHKFSAKRISHRMESLKAFQNI